MMTSCQVSPEPTGISKGGVVGVGAGVGEGGGEAGAAQAPRTVINESAMVDNNLIDLISTPLSRDLGKLERAKDINCPVCIRPVTCHVNRVAFVTSVGGEIARKLITSPRFFHIIDHQVDDPSGRQHFVGSIPIHEILQGFPPPG